MFLNVIVCVDVYASIKMANLYHLHVFTFIYIHVHMPIWHDTN